jgi:hypothetical protein
MIKPIKCENPLANDTALQGYIDYLENVRKMGQNKIQNLKLSDHVTPLTPAHLIGTIDCETIGDQISDNINDLL